MLDRVIDCMADGMQKYRHIVRLPWLPCTLREIFNWHEVDYIVDFMSFAAVCWRKTRFRRCSSCRFSNRFWWRRALNCDWRKYAENKMRKFFRKQLRSSEPISLKLASLLRLCCSPFAQLRWQRQPDNHVVNGQKLFDPKILIPLILIGIQLMMSSYRVYEERIANLSNLWHNEYSSFYSQIHCQVRTSKMATRWNRQLPAKRTSAMFWMQHHCCVNSSVHFQSLTISNVKLIHQKHAIYAEVTRYRLSKLMRYAITSNVTQRTFSLRWSRDFIIFRWNAILQSSFCSMEEVRQMSVKRTRCSVRLGSFTSNMYLLLLINKSISASYIQGRTTTASDLAIRFVVPIVDCGTINQTKSCV